MKLKDLKGILIGNVTIMKWNKKLECFKCVYSCANFHVCNLSEELQNMKVTFIYADEEDQEQNYTIVEAE